MSDVLPSTLVGLSCAAIFIASWRSLATLRIESWPSSLGRWVGWLNAELVRWKALLNAGDGSRSPAVGGARASASAAIASSVLGFGLLGWGGGAIGVVAGPLALRFGLRARNARYAKAVDAAAADIAAALAAALTAGHSVRGALLRAGDTLRPPAAVELRRVAVDLTLGTSPTEALVGLARRTGSGRLESIAGAIELHRRSGGDLAVLLRELAIAFRAQDTARRDARAAMAQARFTALLVGSLPPAAAVLAEFASPGAVSGTLRFGPAAAILMFAAVLLTIGVVQCLRLSRT